jgi:hypothetical protein
VRPSIDFTELLFFINPQADWLITGTIRIANPRLLAARMDMAQTNSTGTFTRVKEVEVSVVEEILGLYLPPVQFSIGWVENSLILGVLSNRRYSGSPSCLFLKFLIWWSNLSMFTVFEVYFSMRFPEAAAKLGDAFCKQFTFVGYGGDNLTSWTIVLMTSARFVAVVFPFKAATICTMSAVKRLQMAIVIIFCLWGLPSAIYQRMAKENEIARLGCYFDISPFIAWLYELVHVLLLVIIPFIIIAVLNTCIVVKIMTRDSVGGSEEQKKGDRVAMTLVTIVTAIFIITAIPYAVHVLVWDFAFASVKLTPRQLEQFGVSHTVAMFTFQFRENVYFFTFFIACKQFREDFLQMIFRCFCKCPISGGPVTHPLH